MSGTVVWQDGDKALVLSALEDGSAVLTASNAVGVSAVAIPAKAVMTLSQMLFAIGFGAATEQLLERMAQLSETQNGA
jgi:hypothetical protein